MVLAFAKEMIEQGYNPATKLWVQCIDIDRVASMMCYIQLSLWNIPAQVIVGNTLTREYREVLYTPAYYLFGWDRKLRLRKFFELMAELETKTDEEPTGTEPTITTSKAKPQRSEAVAENKNTNKKSKKEDSNNGHQINLFDFMIDH
jgi:hypothetical protein